MGVVATIWELLPEVWLLPGGSSPQLPAQPCGTLPALTAPEGAGCKLSSQAGWKWKMSEQRRWDYPAKGFPSSQAALEEGRTLHSMHPGTATSLLCASFCLLRKTQTGKRGNRELWRGSNIQLDEIIAHLQAVEQEKSQQPPSK